MTLKDFERRIQTNIHPDLRIIPHPVNTDVAGVYFRDAFLCGMPNHNIYERKNENYCDAYGTPHATYPDVEARLWNYVNEMKKDNTFYDLLAKDYKNL